MQLLETGPGVRIQQEITPPEIRATILPCALGFLGLSMTGLQSQGTCLCLLETVPAKNC